MTQEFVTLFLFLNSFLIFSNLKADYTKAISIKAKQWEVVDIIIKSKEKVSNPFLNTSTVQFVNKSDTLNIPLIYNGDQDWLIRFSNKKKGEWNFLVKSDIKSLNKISGSISIIENNEHRGAVRLSSKDKRNFYYETGDRYTPIAFECDWLYALDYHNEKGLPKTEHLLDLIKKNGFNQIVMNVFSYDVSWKKDSKLKDRPDHEFGGPKVIFPFLGNNNKPDYSTLNIEFFKKFDRTIVALNDKKIQAHLMIYVWNKLVSWPDMNSVEDNMYYDYVIKRYQAFPNILWDVSKEALFYGRANEEYISERIKRIRDKDEYNRLVTVHDYKFCKNHSTEVDYISTQDWSHNLYDAMQKAYNQFDKPIFNIEHGGYEESDYTVFTGNFVNAETCLRRNYLCLFAGVGTTYYWQGTSWNVMIYNPFEDKKVVYKPKYEYFKHLKNFMDQFKNEDLKPIPWANCGVYALGNKTGLKLHYVPKENFRTKISRFLGANKKGKIKTFYWFNTLTGEKTELKNVEGANYNENPWEGKTDAIIVSRVTEK